jgi:acetylcholinesterase
LEVCRTSPYVDILTETGDPSKVTIWGESAGAASVGFHLVAYNGRDDKLFRAGIMESGNPINYGATNGSDYYQPIYAALVEAGGCSNCSDSLDCLRKLPLFVLNNILNTTEFNSGWNPAFDGDFIARLGSEQLADGSFVRVPVISGAKTDEGTAFSPQGINNTADFVHYLNSESQVFSEGFKLNVLATTNVQNAWPENIVQEILHAYPADPNDGIPSSETLGGDVVLGPPFGAMYRRSAAYFGDEVFIAGRRLTCYTWAAANISAYCYRFNAIPATSGWPYGVTHFTEVAFVFNNVDGFGYSVNPFANRSDSYTELSSLMSKSWASFVYDLDPNGWVGRDTNVPAWPAYSVQSPMNMVWEANFTSHTEPDTFRAEGMDILNANWKLILR